MFHRLDTTGARPIDAMLVDDQLRRAAEKGLLPEKLRDLSRRLRAAERRTPTGYGQKYVQNYRKWLDDIRRCKFSTMRDGRARSFLSKYGPSVEAVCLSSTVDRRRQLREAGRL